MPNEKHDRWVREALLISHIYLGAIATESKDGLHKALEGTEELLESHEKLLKEGEDASPE